MILLFLSFQDSGLVEKTLNATPYNAIGYGLALAILTTGIIALWFNNKGLTAELKNLNAERIEDYKELTGTANAMNNNLANQIERFQRSDTNQTEMLKTMQKMQGDIKTVISNLKTKEGAKG